MKVLGFYLGGHDSNLSLVNEDGSVLYYKAERLKQHKHKRADLNWVKEICDANGFIPDIVCYSDGNRNGLGICDAGKLFQKTESIPELFPVDTYIVDHHYAHILSGWLVSSDSCGYGVSIDGKGDHGLKCTIVEHPFDLDQVSTVYSSADRCYCLMFNRIGKLMHLSGGDLDHAGKVMGLHAYGTVDQEYVEKYSGRQYAENPMLLMEEEFHGYKISELYDQEETLFKDWVASFHALMERYIVAMFQEHIPMEEEVVYAGGCAQNTVYNVTLKELYPKLNIPPHCYDGGISLGCIKLIAMMKNLALNVEAFPFSQQSQDLGYADQETIQKVAKLLAQGKIVGWCQGLGEVGPRALGHRSLLMDPSLKDAKEILNTRVKKRESWRPYAASVRVENLNRLTGVDYDCSYMLHAVQVKESYHDMLVAVVHADGTCRFQSVARTEHLETYYDLLQEFESITGIPGIMNTSLNLGGKPIVSGREEAEELFREMDLDAMCIGNEVWLKEEKRG